MERQITDNTVASLLVLIIVFLLGILIGALLVKLENNLKQPQNKEINYKSQIVWQIENLK